MPAKRMLLPHVWRSGLCVKFDAGTLTTTFYLPSDVAITAKHTYKDGDHLYYKIFSVKDPSKKKKSAWRILFEEIGGLCMRTDSALKNVEFVEFK